MNVGVWVSCTWTMAVTGVVALALVLCASPAQAQVDGASAGERYFHRAARQYVGENLSEAQRLVTEGLQADPGHPKLIALREKLRQQQKAQSKSDDAGQQEESSQQQGGQQNSQQQGSQRQGQQRGRQGQQQRSGEQGSQQPPEDAPDAQRQQQSEAAQQQARRRADGTTERRPEGLSREQAARILQALEGQEKQLLREVQKRPATETNVEKDW